jgi:hypothetical protein
MSDFLAQLAHSFANQAGIWFVGVILALLGVFSGKLVETIKFALNKADIRTKYYEELASDISQLVFIIDRLVNVYYGQPWTGDEDDEDEKDDEKKSKGAIAEEYNRLMNLVSGKEFVYLSWLQRYWNTKQVEEFTRLMEKVRSVDATMIAMNEGLDREKGIAELKSLYASLRETTRTLLLASI